MFVYQRVMAIFVDFFITGDLVMIYVMVIVWGL